MNYIKIVIIILCFFGQNHRVYSIPSDSILINTPEGVQIIISNTKIELSQCDFHSTERRIIMEGLQNTRVVRFLLNIDKITKYIEDKRFVIISEPQRDVNIHFFPNYNKWSFNIYAENKVGAVNFKEIVLREFLNFQDMELMKKSVPLRKVVKVDPFKFYKEAGLYNIYRKGMGTSVGLYEDKEEGEFYFPTDSSLKYICDLLGVFYGFEISDYMLHNWNSSNEYRFKSNWDIEQIRKSLIDFFGVDLQLVDGKVESIIIWRKNFLK